MEHSQISNLKYQKYSGAGNKFAIVNSLNPVVKDQKDVLNHLVDINPDIDGVIFLEESLLADFRMEYFNKDGSGNTLCGNGLRCTAKYVYDNGLWNDSKVTIGTVGKIFNIIKCDDDQFSIAFPEPEFINIDIPLMLNTDDWLEQINFSYVDIGSPHVVIFVNEMKHRELSNLENLDVDKIGRIIRHHREFMPEGVNVNFVKVKRSELKLRSYERGVEGETLSCGTGALSSAIVAALKFELTPPINLLTRSGVKLTVNFDFPDSIENLSLTGPAERYQK